jgi:Na+-driven multidrug efflux pump
MDSSDENLDIKGSFDLDAANKDDAENIDNKVSVDTKAKPRSKIASYKELLVFISTTIIIMLSEPLLSLVDTTIVGKFASTTSRSTGAMRNIAPETLHLAALGPATMLCDNAFYLTYFLAIATTNQLAKATAKEDYDLQVKTTSESLGVASIFGVIITITIFGFGDSILKYIIGNGGAIVSGFDMTSSIISLSWDYTKIRGIIAPISIMGMIAQSVCLSTLDTKTPALAVLVATIVNVIGDVILVAKYNMGLRGAALATSAAGFVSSFLLIHESRKKVERWRSMRYHSNIKEASSKKRIPQYFVKLPNIKSFISLAKLAGPIFFVIIGKLICYSAMTLKASDFGMLSLAAHNVMIRLFFFFCVFGDSFSLAAQSFLPAALYSGDEITIQENESDVSNDHKRMTKSLLKRIFAIAGTMSLVNSALSRMILMQGGSFFTNDKRILALLSVPNRVLYMMGSVLLHPIIMALEGSILATRDLKFLVGAYTLTMSVMLSLLEFGTSSFTGVWRALFSFQLIRCIIFGLRVFNKTRETNKAVTST